MPTRCRLTTCPTEVTFDLQKLRFFPFFIALILPAALNAQTCSTSSTVRFQTTLGGIDVVLTPSVTPLTVANFMTYVCSGAYTSGYFDVDRTKPYTGGTIIHRSLNASNQTPPFYLIQGGGFALGAGNLPALIPQNAPVTNEFKTSNTRGTLAMAQYGSDINSATNEWYFNTIDNNSGLSNLDSQSFTVFGNVANDASLAVMDAINALPTYSYNAGQSANFANLPLQNYASGLIKPSNYIFVNSRCVLPSFIFVTRLSASVADFHSLFDVVFWRLRSKRRTSSMMVSGMVGSVDALFTSGVSAFKVRRRAM